MKVKLSDILYTLEDGQLNLENKVVMGAVPSSEGGGGKKLVPLDLEIL